MSKLMLRFLKLVIIRVVRQSMLKTRLFSTLHERADDKFVFSRSQQS